MGTQSCSLKGHHLLDTLHCPLFLAPLNKNTATAFLPRLFFPAALSYRGGPSEGWVLWVGEGGVVTEIIRGTGVRGRGLGATQVVHPGKMVGTYIKRGLPTWLLNWVLFSPEGISDEMLAE